MNIDVVLAGVGGQRVLTLGSILAAAARIDGFEVMLSELHGMAQRGGSVLAHLRIADSTIHSPLIAAASADILVATEPLEALRSVPLLKPLGIVVTAVEAHRNIPDYPAEDELRARLRALPHSVLVDARTVAREAAGTVEAAHLVLAGAACRLLPVRPTSVEQVIRATQTNLAPPKLEKHLAAFRAGREPRPCPRS